MCFSCDYLVGEDRIGKEMGSLGYVVGNDIIFCVIFVLFFFGYIDVKLFFFISKLLIKYLVKWRFF